ncbi:MAG TPA: ATP-binding protein [Candidatus Acidoferrales bacterium]|nr:ATP-binding protein [Candidatus Acidoferrales bacterium]
MKAFAESKNISNDNESLLSRVASFAEEFLRTLPCVVYQASDSGRLTFISENVSSLLGFKPEELIRDGGLWQDRIFPQDAEAFRQSLRDLDHVRSVSLVHRLVNRWGLPVWVHHGLHKIAESEGHIVRGCLLSIGEELKVRELSQSAVERFIHKLGNHFTLLHVVLGSLRRVLPASRETDVLHETVDRAIQLTRSFSEYNQRPSCWLDSVEIIQVLAEALMRTKSAFAEKQIALEERIEPSLAAVTVSGDPFLLELAVTHLLQNALEATPPGGKVFLDAWAEAFHAGRTVAKLRIRDTGPGIDEESLRHIWTPFFTTKEGHEGLGLTMARRFAEMHCGVLHLTTQLGKGTEVSLSVPAVSKSRP